VPEQDHIDSKVSTSSSEDVNAHQRSRSMLSKLRKLQNTHGQTDAIEHLWVIIKATGCNFTEKETKRTSNC